MTRKINKNFAMFYFYLKLFIGIFCAVLMFYPIFCIKQPWYCYHIINVGIDKSLQFVHCIIITPIESVCLVKNMIINSQLQRIQLLWLLILL